MVAFVSSLLLRLPWNLQEAALDLALAVAVASAYAFAAVAIARGEFDSGMKWILLTSATSVLARHLVRLPMRPAA